jgi:hypothetical protein
MTQIKDVLGDGAYGDGYLAACLHAYGYNSETVLHHLLEGSVKPEVQALDPTLSSWSPPSVVVAAGAGSSSGGAACVGATRSSGQGGAGPSWQAMRADADALTQQKAVLLQAQQQGRPPKVCRGKVQTWLCRQSLNECNCRQSLNECKCRQSLNEGKCRQSMNECKCRQSLNEGKVCE